MTVTIGFPIQPEATEYTIAFPPGLIVLTA